MSEKFSTDGVAQALIKGFQKGMLLKSGQSYVQWTGLERKGRGKGPADVPLSSFRFEDICTSSLEFDKREPVMQLYEISDDEVHADVVQSVAFNAEGSSQCNRSVIEPIKLFCYSCVKIEKNAHPNTMAVVYGVF